MKYRRIGTFLFWGAYQIVEDFEYRTKIRGYTAEAEQYSLSRDGFLRIKKYYAWDGPSGAVKTRSFVASSCIHDVLCEMINSRKLPPILQPLADEEMLIINKSQNMSTWRRVLSYNIVRNFQLRKRKPHTFKVHEVIV